MKKQKWFSLLLAVTMLFACIPAGITAETEEGVIEEPALATETVSEAPVPEPAPAEEKKEEKTEEPAPAVEEPKEEKTPAADEPAEETPDAADGGDEAPGAEEIRDEEAGTEAQDGDTSGEQTGPETTDEEEPGDGTEAGQPGAEEIPAAEPFAAGPATLSAGKVFTDRNLKKAAGTVDEEIVVYAAERITGEGELKDGDVIRIIANIDGQAATLYVKNERLAYLSDEETAAYRNGNHEGIEYENIKLEPAVFTAEAGEEEAEAAEGTGSEGNADGTADETASEGNADGTADETVSEENPEETADENPEDQNDESGDEAAPAVTAEADPAAEETTGENQEDENDEGADEAVPAVTEEAAPAEEGTADEGQDALYTRSNIYGPKGLTPAAGETDGDNEAPEGIPETGTEGTGEPDGTGEADGTGEEPAGEPDGTENTGIITKQPEDYTGLPGTQAVFTVEAEGEGLTYQWQYKSTSMTNFKNSPASGNKTDTVRIDIEEHKDGYQYRCIVTDGSGQSETTEAAVLHVSSGIEITKQPEDYTGAPGTKAVFTVEAEGEGLTYQWQYKTAVMTGFKDSPASGNKTDTVTIDIEEHKDGYQYRCVIKNSRGKSETTEPAVLHVSNALEITKQPEDFTGEPGGQAVFTVEAEGEGLTYQWQYKSGSMTSFK